MGFLGLKGCVTEPILTDCCWHGVCFECAVAYDHSDIDLVKSVVLGHWLTAFCLWCISIYNLHCWYVESSGYYNQQAKKMDEQIKFLSEEKFESKDNYKDNKDNKDNKNKKTSATTLSPADPTGIIAEKANKEEEPLQYPWFRVIQIWYPFITGWFALFRVEYELGKPLLIGAALHNLCEWGMTCYAYYNTTNDRHRYFIASMIWIWFVISCVVVIPKFPFYALAEQVSGIALDFLLPLTWFLIMKQMDNPIDRAMYKLAFIAHMVHLFGTILPLVVENFIVGQSYYASIFMEFLIFFTSACTHALYTTFTNIFQSRVITKYHREYPEKFILKNKLCYYLILCTIIGLIPTTLYPAIVGTCPIDHNIATINAINANTTLHNIGHHGEL